MLLVKEGREKGENQIMFLFPISPYSLTKSIRNFALYQFELRGQQIPVRAWHCQAPSEV